MVCLALSVSQGCLILIFVTGLGSLAPPADKNASAEGANGQASAGQASASAGETTAGQASAGGEASTGQTGIEGA